MRSAHTSLLLSNTAMLHFLIHVLHCRNRLIAMMATIVLRDYPGTYIVTDSTTSNGLNKFITEAGGQHLRCTYSIHILCDTFHEL
jgi:hypothetical protein